MINNLPVHVRCNSPAVLACDVLLHGATFPEVIIPPRSLSFASVVPSAAAVVVRHPECHVHYPVNALTLGGVRSSLAAATVLFRRT